LTQRESMAESGMETSSLAGWSCAMT
jgi:hypothetical protein